MPILVPSNNPLNTPTIDIAQPTAIGGLLPNPTMWASNAPYVQQQLIAVLIDYPGIYDYLPNSEQWIASLKALVEVQTIKIDGLQSNLTVDVDGPPIGNAGEKLNVITKVSRSVSAPVHTWHEVYGLSYTKFWTDHIRLVESDPDLMFPGITAEPLYISAGSPPLTPDMTSFSVLYFEPDPTMTYPTKAWLVTNMQALSNGDLYKGVKEKGGSNSTSELSIEFTALTQIGKGVDIIAANYLKTIKLTDLRPLELQTFTNGIDPNVSAISAGLAEQVSAAVLQG